MEIHQIKQQLRITEVLAHYNLEMNKNEMLSCPFHKDKKPSMQVYPKTDTCYCFSGNCKTHGKSIDVIDFVMMKEARAGQEITKYEAIEKCKSLIHPTTLMQIVPTKSEEMTPNKNYPQDFEIMQSSFLSSKIARKYVESRNLDWKLLQIGYNAFKSSKFDYLRGCITFGLRNKEGKIVSLYGRSIHNSQSGASHFYTANRQGLYPKYPGQETKKLILTESIIDAASLELSIDNEQFSILALYGTNGLTKLHLDAIKNLKELNEIILWFDGDSAGSNATDKYSIEIRNLLPNITVTKVETPENEDINSLLEGHEPTILNELLENRTAFLIKTTNKSNESTNNLAITDKQPSANYQINPLSNQLITDNPNNLVYTTQTAVYYIKGGIRKDLDSLKVTLVVAHLENKQKSRNKLDLYEDKQTEKIARESADKLQLRADLIEQDLYMLTDLLDQYRESVAPTGENDETKKVIISKEEKEKCYEFLKNPFLLENINVLIGKSGVVGEIKNRIFLFGIASTYKMENTLHALIQGSSGSGKTHLLATIMDFMPPEDTINLTRVTESSFYNYGEYELSNKLIGMEDFDGLEEKAELAFRELMSKGEISSSTSGKNEHTGQIAAYIKTVYGPIASLSATTKGEIYEDNMSRCFLISVDESEGQTANIIKYQNQRAAGRINKKEEKEIQEFLRNCMRLLKPLDVVNPFADKIDLPKEAHKIRRLNELFQSYVKQITLLNQYQRSIASTGELITDKEDVRMAIEIMFDSIILKVDELDGSLRDFYEKLKSYVLSKSKEYEFTRREIRAETRTSNTQLHRFMKHLIDLEYIYLSSGYDNRGHKYKIAYWDNMDVLRNKIKEDLNNQLDKL